MLSSDPSLIQYLHHNDKFKNIFPWPKPPTQSKKPIVWSASHVTIGKHITIPCVALYVVKRWHSITHFPILKKKKSRKNSVSGFVIEVRNILGNGKAPGCYLFGYADTRVQKSTPTKTLSLSKSVLSVYGQSLYESVVMVHAVYSTASLAWWQGCFVLRHFLHCKEYLQT